MVAWLMQMSDAACWQGRDRLYLSMIVMKTASTIDIRYIKAAYKEYSCDPFHVRAWL